MGLLGYLENLVNNAEIKIQQLEQEKQILLQKIAEYEKEEPVKDVVELEDK